MVIQILTKILGALRTRWLYKDFFCISDKISNLCYKLFLCVTWLICINFWLVLYHYLCFVAQLPYLVLFDWVTLFKKLAYYVTKRCSKFWPIFLGQTRKQDVCLRTSFAYSSYLCLRNKRLIGSKLLQALNIDAQEATRPHCWSSEILASHLWGLQFKYQSPYSIQYTTLTNCMYWFPLPTKRPLVIRPVQCWRWH